MDYRTLAAGVLGVGLGLVLLAYPEAVIRAQFAGRLPQDKGGEYGTDGAASGRLPLVVRALGVLVAGAGGYFAASAFGLL